MARAKSEIDLALFTLLERGEVATQLTMSREIGVSIGLVNALLRRAIRKGYVKVKAVPCRRYVYYLTPHGFAEKSRLVAEYLESSLRFFREVRNQYADGLRSFQAWGWCRFALAGGGELADIAILAARDCGAEVLAVIDPHTNRSRVAGVPICRSLEELSGVDAVVLTDGRNPQSTYDLVVQKVESRRILAPAFLRVVQRDAPFYSAQELES